jgi:hypothetical protein
MQSSFRILLVLAMAAAGAGKVMADAGVVCLSGQGTNTVIQVRGDKNDDWRFQVSTDLVRWSNAPALGVLLSGGKNAPTRAVGAPTARQFFYRTTKTAGLYDPTLLRTFSLTFTQSTWQTLLTTGRTTGSNTPCTLVMDNGATNQGVGARYRGNTSFTGVGGVGAPVKKSVNLDINWVSTNADLMGFKTINLNNAYADSSVMRETLYFNVMRRYAVCPRGCLAKLYINGAYWGVYSCAQQENTDLIKEYFPSADGDRWRAPNMPVGTGGPGGSSGNSALAYLGTAVATYQSNYELKTDNSTNAWQRLALACQVLNTTPTNQLRDKVEDAFAVDRWLWWLALENIFADDDSYWNKGADYEFYYEPESGRIHPVEHDGNEAFIAGDSSLSPVYGATLTNRPVLYRLLNVPELRQRYLAHMRTVLQETYNPTNLTPVINAYAALSADAIASDPKKSFTMAAYTNELVVLRTYVTNRYTYLTTHAELKSLAPTIVAVYDPITNLTAGQIPFVTAQVQAAGTNGISSVWLYHRGKSYGRFAVAQMFDDGAHGDGLAGDGVYGGATTNYPAGTRVRYYVEARSANSAKAASFFPARAEEDVLHYRVGLTNAANSPVIISELMAANITTLADDQGEYDDWIELRNVTDQEVELTGRYLSDEPNNPRKWQFPAGTKIPADGYLVVWADEDGKATNGLHASFKLEKNGEELYLTDTDANFNAVLDSVIFGVQETDRSYGRTAADADVWAIMDPTPGQANK